MTEESPQRKCIVEFKVHIHRWNQESDLEAQDIIDAVEKAIIEYYELEEEEDEGIVFEPDETLDLGDSEERG